MSLFGSAKEDLPSSNVLAMRFAVEQGKDFKDLYGERIKKLFKSGHGPHQIVDDLKLRVEFPLVSDKTLANAVSRALTGYKGEFDTNTTSESPYEGLLSQADYAAIQAQQRSGLSIATANERWQNDPQRWSPKEIAQLKLLANQPEFKKKARYHLPTLDYEKIADILDQQFHEGAQRRTAASVKTALSKNQERE